MKTASTITRKIKIFAATALLGATPLFLSPWALAQTAEKAATAVSSPAPVLLASIYELEPMKVRLHLANPAGSAVAVTIKDEQGKEVIKESFWTTTFSLALDLNYTPAGTYTLQVANRKEVITRSFTVNTSTERITLAQALEHSPGSALIGAIYEVEPQKVKVHVVNPSGKKVQIVVRNEKGEVVLRKMTSGGNEGLLLDLSRMADGAHTVQFSNQSGQVSRTFVTATVSSRSIAWDSQGTEYNTTAAK
jgi:hypothetical protein